MVSHGTLLYLKAAGNADDAGSGLPWCLHHTHWSRCARSQLKDRRQWMEHGDGTGGLRL